MERFLSDLEYYQSGRELKKKENIHVVLWLVKDFAWLMHFKVLGLVMAIPTVVLAIVLTVKSLMVLFDTYYKWLFFQLKYVFKVGISGSEIIPELQIDKEELARFDALDISMYNFEDIFDFAESKGLLKKSKHKILRFLGYGDLGFENYAGMRTRIMNDVLSDYYHNLAVTCWIVGNVIWMVGEFFFDDTIRYISVPFFVIGLMVLGWYHLYVKGKIKTKDSIEEPSVKQ